MYGCEMDGWSRREYNFLSCYDSADGNGIVNVNVEFAEGYLIVGVFRCSRKSVSGKSVSAETDFLRISVSASQIC